MECVRKPYISTTPLTYVMNGSSGAVGLLAMGAILITAGISVITTQQDNQTRILGVVLVGIGATLTALHEVLFRNKQVVPT